MTISSNNRKAGPYVGNGTASVFPFAFKIFQASDLEVVRLTVATSVETILELTTNYTVTLNSDQDSNPGGSITLVGGALATGYNLVITSDIENLQPTDLTNQGGFYPDVINDALDRATIQIQQLQEQTDRSIKVPITNPTTIAELTADLIRLADSADNIDIVANDKANVDTVATNIASVNTVSGSIANVNTVGADIAAVTTVANDLNEPVSEIETVANSIANVNTVGNNITNVNTTAANIANVNAVGSDLLEPVSEINTVAVNIADVNTVATNISDVNTVAANMSDINTVNDNIASVNTAAANVVDINNFADVYQGAKAADPTLRNDGSALHAGDMYFNTTINELRIYSGTSWIAGTAGTLAVQRFSGTGAATNFTLATAPSGENNTQAYINGVYQQKDTYGVSGVTLTFSTAPPAGTENIEVVTISTLALGETDASLVAYLPAGAGAEQRSSQSKMRDFVSVKDFGAKGDWNPVTHTGTDDTAKIQAAVNSGYAIYFPKGSYKISSPITLSSGVHIFGESWGNCAVFAYGCNAFKLNSNTNNVVIEALSISSYAANTAIDPKTFTGISCEGISGQLCSWVTVRDVYMRGWQYCIDWQWTSNSCIDNVDTIFCATGVRLFGQSVNNTINNSRIVANGGMHSIKLQQDGTNAGEGLMVSNCLLASGQYGIYGGRFLSLNVSNCIIDLITDSALYLSEPKALMLTNCWVYAVNYGIYLAALGSAAPLGASITGNKIITTAAGSTPIKINGNNKDIAVTGGSLESNNGYGAWVDGGNITFAGVNISTTNPVGIFFGLTTNCVAVGITGTKTVTYYERSKTSDQVIYASAVQFPVTQVPSGDANTLDDYEEGSWTPIMSADGGGVIQFTATSAIGKYVKVGRLVTVTCEYAYSSIGSVGGSFGFMTGLPFACENNNVESTFAAPIEQAAFDTRNFYGYFLSGGVAIAFRYNNGSGALYNGATLMVGVNFPSSGTVRFVMSYLTSA